ncbi:MAG: general secretion pathway protein GspB [Candidatus Omnitrophica bacterium]|nr:general secretion pathway protein GspB [Candidatus Omnitrophota bacterium]
MSKNSAVIIFTLLSLVFINAASGEEEFVYNSKGKRDPFIPLVTPDGRFLKLDKEEQTQGGLMIEGIIYDKQGVSYAIVNGEVVKIGDRVADYQVLKIEDQKIIFIKEGEPIEVEIKKEEP